MVIFLYFDCSAVTFHDSLAILLASSLLSQHQVLWARGVGQEGGASAPDSTKGAGAAPAQTFIQANIHQD